MMPKQIVRVLEFDPFDSPLDRDPLALIIEMAVMRVRGAPEDYIENHCQHRQSLPHGASRSLSIVS